MTVNVSITDPLALMSATPVTWSPAKLYPNTYYILNLQTTPSSPLNITAQSARFFVTAGTDQTCLSIPTTSKTASHTPTAVSSQSGAKHGVSGGAIAGAIIGVLIVVALVACFVFLYMRSRNRRRDRFKVMDSFLPSTGVTPTVEKDPTSPGPTTSPGGNNKYSGLLAAIGIGKSPNNHSRNLDDNSPDTRGNRRSQSYYQNASTFSPETTLEGAGTEYHKGSAGSSTDLGAVATAMTTSHNRRGSVSKSVTTRHSSSVTSFTQSANLAYVEQQRDGRSSSTDEGEQHPSQTAATPGGTGRWVSSPQKRSSVKSKRSLSTSFMPQVRRSVTGSASGGEEDIQMSPVTSTSTTSAQGWTGPSRSASMKRSNSLPPGAAVPAVVTAQNSPVSGTESTTHPPPSFPITPTPNRRPSAGGSRPVVRKKAPQLPAGILVNENVSSSNPNTPITPAPGSSTSAYNNSNQLQPPYSFLPHASASTSSLGTTGTQGGASRMNQGTPGKRTSVDALGAGMLNKRSSSPPVSASDTVFHSFAGAKKGGAVLLMPDMPMTQPR